jgi:hypothetical protein
MSTGERADASDASRPGVLDLGRLREVVTVLTRLPTYWVVVVLIAVLLSCVTVTRAAGGGTSVRFALTTTAVWLLAIVWVPAAVRTLAVVLRSVKAFGVELSTAGLFELFRHEPTNATLAPAEAQRDEVTAAPVDEEFEEFGEFLEAPESAFDPEATAGYDRGGRPDWTQERDTIYAQNQELFLVHSIQPSPREGQKYEVFVVLRGAHGTQPSDVVDQAEFFLGRFWGNQVFSVRNPDVGGTIGLRTAAYGPTLCICRVTFKDTSLAPIVLHRFLDFEMGWVFDAAAKAFSSTSAAS